MTSHKPMSKPRSLLSKTDKAYLCTCEVTLSLSYNTCAHIPTLKATHKHTVIDMHTYNHQIPPPPHPIMPVSQTRDVPAQLLPDHYITDSTSIGLWSDDRTSTGLWSDSGTSTGLWSDDRTSTGFVEWWQDLHWLLWNKPASPDAHGLRRQHPLIDPVTWMQVDPTEW